MHSTLRTPTGTVPAPEACLLRIKARSAPDPVHMLFEWFRFVRDLTTHLTDFLQPGPGASRQVFAKKSHNCISAGVYVLAVQTQHLRREGVTALVRKWLQADWDQEGSDVGPQADWLRLAQHECPNDICRICTASL
jgi:hypothetical protein